MNDKWKYVSLAKCIGVIVWSLIGFCMFFIPFSFDNSILSISASPLFGDGTLLKSMDNASIGFANSFGTSTGLSVVLKIAAYCYLIIPIVSIIMGTVLAICRNKIVRIIFNVFGIIFGILLIYTAICMILYVVSIIMYCLQIDSSALQNLGSVVVNNGIIFAILATVFSFIMGRKQFTWYANPFPDEDN